MVRCSPRSTNRHRSGQRGTPRGRVRPADVIVCDTGPLVAAAISNDDDHHACVELFTALHLAGRQILIPAPVVAEVGYLLAREAGPTVEAAFLRSLADGDFVTVAPTAADYARMADLVPSVWRSTAWYHGRRSGRRCRTTRPAGDCHIGPQAFHRRSTPAHAGPHAPPVRRATPRFEVTGNRRLHRQERPFDSHAADPEPPSRNASNLRCA